MFEIEIKFLNINESNLKLGYKLTYVEVLTQ